MTDQAHIDLLRSFRSVQICLRELIAATANCGVRAALLEHGTLAAAMRESCIQLVRYADLLDKNMAPEEERCGSCPTCRFVAALEEHDALALVGGALMCELTEPVLAAWVRAESTQQRQSYAGLRLVKDEQSPSEGAT